jgi:PAS domain S-box-containing protein
MHLIRAFRNLRIRYKLLIGYSAVFFLCLSLGSWALYSVVRSSIEASIESELQNTTTTILNMVRTSAATSIKNHLRAVAEKNLEIANHFHREALAGALSMEEARERVRDIFLSQTIGQTGYIYCLQSNGVIAVHPRQALLGEDLSRHAFIREQKSRKEGYLEYEWMNPGETVTRPKALFMTYFAPWDWIISVSSYREEFHALVNVEDFRDSILSLKFGQTGYSYIIDAKGNMVLHPRLSGNFLQARDRDGRQFVQEMLTRKSGKIIYSWENPGEGDPREKLVIFNYLPEYQWIVASSSYLDEFYAPLATLRQLILGVVAISFVLMLPLTLRISASITNPLQALMRHFSSGAAGDHQIRMAVRSQDEVGQLAHYFNQFMERLEIYSASLETEIRERLKAEAAIRQSEAKYRELVENANSIILRLDSAGRITFFNEFAQKFFGYGASDILGRGIVGSLIPPATHSGRDQSDLIRRVYTQPQAFSAFESEAQRPHGGGWALIAWTNRAIQDAQGRTVGCLWVGNDITQTREAELRVVRLQLYFKSIIDAMPSILVAVDRNGVVTQWNREAEQVTGVRHTEALGRDLAEVFPMLRAHLDLVRQAVRQRSVRQAEKIAYTHQGKPRYADIMIYPLEVDGMQGAVIRVDDVTARVRLEDTMVQTEKMLSVGGLAAGMAHEINNPLSGMLQNAQNIMRRIDPALPQNLAVAAACGVDLPRLHTYLEARGVLRFVEGIRQSGERASTTVADMLNFSRQSDSRLVPTRLETLVDKTVGLAAHDYDLRKKYDFREIQIVREFEANLPEVLCAATEIEQVLLNLLRNASQALRVSQPPPSPPRITLRLKHADGHVRLEVADNGPGMDEETRRRVFEPFFTTKEVGVGTGLGLSVSYFIVTNHHHGTLRVESSPGQGACFILHLPVAAPAGRDA